MNGIELRGIGDNKQKSKQETLISEIITHVNSIEEKMTRIESTISEIKDMYLVNKLDIINLRNETDKIRSTSPNLNKNTQRIIEDVHELSHDIENLKDLKKLKKSVSDLESFMSREMKDIQVLRNSYSKEPIIKEQRTNEPKNLRCKKCRTVLNINATFCTRCGKRKG